MMAGEYSTRWRRALAGLLQVIALIAAPALGFTAEDPLKEARRLHAQGQGAQALAKLDALLAASPDNAAARFLKGVILADEKKTDEAIAVFSLLTQDFPELPEPYNNLAVLHAAKGDYELARQSLERAVVANPGYATAHENLGDLYARLALRSYDRALELERNNPPLEKKRALLQQLPAPTPGRAGTPATGSSK